jgi:hypothetical protein
MEMKVCFEKVGTNPNQKYNHNITIKTGYPINEHLCQKMEGMISAGTQATSRTQYAMPNKDNVSKVHAYILHAHGATLNQYMNKTYFQRSKC